MSSPAVTTEQEAAQPDAAHAAHADTAEGPVAGPRVSIPGLCVLTGLVGLGCFTLSLVLSEASFPRLPFALLLAGAASVLQVIPMRLSHEAEGENLHLEEAFLIAMTVYLSAPEVLAGLGLAVAIGGIRHRRGWMKTTFNTGQLVTAAGAGVVIAQWLGAGNGQLSERALFAAAVGSLVYSVVSMLAVAGIISVIQRTPFWSGVADGLEIRFAVWMSSLAVGMLIAVAIERRAWMLPVASVPIVMLQLTYSRSFRQYRQRRRTERLYDATSSIRSSIDSKRVKEQLVRAAQELLDAGTGAIVPAEGRAAPGALRVALDADTAIEVRDRLAGGEWDDNDEFMLRALGSVASNALSNAALFEQVRTITGSLGEGVIALDRDGRIEFVNPAVETILGWTREELLGRHPHEVFHAHEGPLRSDASCALVAPLFGGNTLKDNDTVFTRSDGSFLPTAYTASPVMRDGQLVGAVIAFHDISERKGFEQQLTYQAFHDELTGLPNRALFVDRLGHAQARMTRTGALYALLFIDLDRFKVVNDSLGHHVGDELLIEVGRRLEGCLRPGDTLARFGGDEFVALIEDLEHDDEAVAVARRLLEAMQDHIRVAERDLAVSCSIGVVIGDADGRGPDECLRDADVAMYRAKARGKACYEVFRPDCSPDELDRLDLEIELRKALEAGGLELHYQPIFTADGHEVRSVEALLRWSHPTRGMVPPAEFIPLAEETGLILPLGAWVLEEACRQMKEWEASRPETATLVVSVNLSPRQFRQPDLGEQVGAVLRRTGLAASRLCVEVTEGAMVDDVESATLALHRLKELGVAVSIDDFGTGYSSLSYLKRFPIDYVKIDGSFIRGLGEERVDSEIVRSVIRLAAAIGIQAVAEGVEDADQLRLLQALDCPLVQGYHLGRPQPLEHVIRLVDDLANPRPTPEPLVTASYSSTMTR